MTLQMLAALPLVASPSVTRSGPHRAAPTSLDVPIVVQAPERCGQAALEAVAAGTARDAVYPATLVDVKRGLGSITEVRR